MNEFLEVAKVIGIPLAMCLFIAIFGAKKKPVWVFYHYVERETEQNAQLVAELRLRLEKSEKSAEKWEEIAIRGMRVAEKTAGKGPKGGDT